MQTVMKFLLLTLLILQVVLMVTGKICSYAYYPAKTGECKLCGTCGIGEGLEKNCGHDENGNIIPGKSQCRKCSKDEYRMQYMSTTVCIPCNKCYGKRFRVMCSATSDAVCEDCPKGFYEFNNNCHKCSRCCHGSKGVKRMSKCLDDGMAESHSCTPNPSCFSFATYSQKLDSFLARLKADIAKSKRRMQKNKKLQAKLAQETDRLLKKQSAMLKDTKARIEGNLANLAKQQKIGYVGLG